jgi:hypothetical protein
VLAPQRSERSLAQWTLSPSSCLTSAGATAMADSALEQLRTGIPAARCLPLLRSVAPRDAGGVVLDYLEDLQLAVQVAPC